MTHEEFAHLCLSIKKGAIDIEIPCCANCEHYVCSNESYTNATAKSGIDAVAKLLDEMAAELCVDDDEDEGPAKYECRHPALESDDPFVAAWIETTPEDFCSRFEQRKD